MDQITHTPIDSPYARLSRLRDVLGMIQNEAMTPTRGSPTVMQAKLNFISDLCARAIRESRA